MAIPCVRSHLSTRQISLVERSTSMCAAIRVRGPLCLGLVVSGLPSVPLKRSTAMNGVVQCRDQTNPRCRVLMDQAGRVARPDFCRRRVRFQTIYHGRKSCLQLGRCLLSVLWPCKACIKYTTSCTSKYDIPYHDSLQNFRRRRIVQRRSKMAIQLQSNK